MTVRVCVTVVQDNKEQIAHQDWLHVPQRLYSDVISGAPTAVNAALFKLTKGYADTHHRVPATK